MFKEWINKFPDNIFTTNGKVVYCQPCDQQVACKKLSHLNQHVETKKHVENVERKKSKPKQAFLEASFSNAEKTDPFVEELCDALIASNIPFNKINNSTLKHWLMKYTNRRIPDQSTLRKGYLDVCFRAAVSRIKQKIGNNYVWATVDETTDCLGRYVCNLLVGKMSANSYYPPHLISVKMLDKVNYSTITRFVNDGLKEFGIGENHLLLLTTDAARYMVKAGKTLKTLFPNMTHLTCLCHGLHRVAEEVREYFPHVDELIASTKKVFTKAPSRIKKYKEAFPNLQLPPQPILTRWGSWIEAAVFYSENFESVKLVIDSLNENDAVAIRKAKQAFNDVSVVHQLAYIQSNFANIPQSIKTLETADHQMFNI